MEMEVVRAAVVSTDDTARSSELDQLTSHSLMAASHRLANTALAPPPWIGAPVKRELDLPVVGASPDFNWFLARRIRRSPAIRDDRDWR
jgi:hypothetical protein